MLVYHDYVTGDEIMTDSYKVTEDWDGLVYKIVGKYTTESDANAVAGIEANEEECEVATTTGINCILATRLQETSFEDKKTFKRYFKDYAKAALEKVKEKNPEKVDAFKKDCQDFMKKVIEHFNDLRFFQGESFNPDSLVVLVIHEEIDGSDTPMCYYFKAGLYEEKQ
ncbi:DgyrCDS12543 [Dimorphilus gyrociliatus]|uniref:DgyrCDS12543 n=1 Tax=Dimorphilus gyrociliatus TaxID=2664684 RepID=A0A7I8W8B3_9ANNE|nr:DgyrCDS12543 [Dimorphilus gyrociliatus]